MKIRTKIILAIGLLTFVAILLVFAQYLLEKQRMSDFLNGIREEQEQTFNLLVKLSGADLEIFARDYSYWDDMVNFVKDPDPIFAEENIVEGIDVFNASEAYVYNKEKELIYGYDKAHETMPPVFSDEIFTQLFHNRLTHFFGIKNDHITEFRVGTIHPTNDPDRLTDPVGLLVVGKHWDINHIQSLEELSGADIIFNNETIPREGASVSFPFTVKGINGEIVETFTIVSPFPIISSAQNASERQLWLVIFSYIIALIVVFIFLYLLVGKPIEDLSRGIEKKDINLMKRMQKSPSEFGILAKLVLGFSEHELVLEGKAKDEAILSAVGSGLIAVNLERKITLFNVSAEKLFGVSAEKALGMHTESIFKTETHSGTPFTEDELPISRALKEKKLISEVVLCVKSDGTKFPAVVTAAPVILKGEVIGAVQDLRDITAEETLERSKRDFISLVSHELRTPITSLGWAVEKIESAENIPPEVLQSTIPYMKSALERIRTLVSAMVDVSKIENGSIVTANNSVKIHSLVTRGVEGLKPMIENKKLKINIKDETDGSDTINSDEKLLQIIINNLISNATKYSDEGGEIEIIVKNEHDIGLTIDVSNTGPGIPTEEQPRIFGKMFRATNAKLISPDGVGLGLYISRSFLEKLGGTLSFTSVPNVKTTFTIHLPFSNK